MGYIYKITNKINGKMYIGKTELEPPELRWKEHINESIKERSKNRVFYKALRKYGKENFTFEIIEKTEDDLEKREIYYIDKYRTYVGFKDCNGYNSTLGGDGKAYLNLDDKEVIWYHISNSLYVLTDTAKHFNVDPLTIKKILKKYNIMWHSYKVASKTRAYMRHGAVIQVDPTNTFIVNMFSNFAEVNKYFCKKLDNYTIEEACFKKKNHKAYGFYWYTEFNLPEYIKKDYRLYSNEY